MKIPISALALLLPFLLKAQFTVKEIKEVNPHHKDYTYIFPLLVQANNKAAASKINFDLAKDFLQVDKRKIRKSIFENVWAGKDDVTPQLSDLSYKVLNNDKGIFSIALSAEGCGAYCESFTNYYVYESKSGKRIMLDSLLTKKGYSRLQDSVKQYKRTLLQAQIKIAKDTLPKIPATAGDDKEYYSSMLELYEDCLKETNESATEYLFFYLTHHQLVIILDRCSAHYNRAVDELEGSFVFEFDLKKWNNYLTAYTKSLIK